MLRGNLCPGGAVIKSNAGSPSLLTHTGPACVFKDYDDLTARVDDPDLAVTADSVLILQNGGPVGPIPATRPIATMRADIIGHFQPCMTEIYLHI